ncbi:MAG: glycosyltransferase family 2 protein [Acidobacteriaceae bacterium]|nr:glycosyltransferase family 2 protein [Acidobacteriaceae bacterium]
MDVSVVMATYNRCGLLDEALRALLKQQTSLKYEVIVVDNHSEDGTAAKVQEHAAADSRVRYVYEGRQGVAYGRNAGIRAAVGSALAFCDDDVVVAPDWLQRMWDALSRYPEADFIGGKVLPVWKRPPPSWLKADVAPLALQDRGDKAFRVDEENPVCLISASLGVRRRAFERSGFFDPETQRVKGGVGSTEDYDWELKVWRSGGHGMYVPDVICYCEVPEARMRKRYHRRWHLGHGKFKAMARHREFDGRRLVLDVPLYMYRQAAEAAVQVPLWRLRGRKIEAFESESFLLFCLGFIRERWKAQLLGKSRRGGAQAEASEAAANPNGSETERGASAGTSR